MLFALEILALAGWSVPTELFNRNVSLVGLAPELGRRSRSTYRSWRLSEGQVRPDAFVHIRASRRRHSLLGKLAWQKRRTVALPEVAPSRRFFTR